MSAPPPSATASADASSGGNEWDTLSVRAVEKFRLSARPAIPKTYSGYRHLAVITAVCSAVIALCLTLLRSGAGSGSGSGSGWFESLWTALSDRAVWITCVCTFVFANGLEYYAHRYLMHPAERHTRHSALHHRFFTNAVMALDDFTADPNAILIHPMACVMVFGVALPVVGAVLSLAAWNWRVGVAFELTGAWYYVSYEWMHLMYHMDESRWTLLRYVPFLAFLRRHHQIHHYMPHMRSLNFNITWPIFDVLCGTLTTAMPSAVTSASTATAATAAAAARS